MAQVANEHDMTEETTQAAKASPSCVQSKRRSDRVFNQEAVEFIKEKLQSKLDEKDSRRLFEFYAHDEGAQRLEAHDILTLLMDILTVSDWPLIVPHETLDAVLHELCLDEKCDISSVSWFDFKSFFVFLQERPLQHLLGLLTKAFSKPQLLHSRVIVIKEQSKAKEQEQELKEQNYDQKQWKSAIEKLISEASHIFVFVESEKPQRVLASLSTLWRSRSR